MVSYQAWKANPGDGQALDSYLAHLSQSNGKATQAQQLAFWINAFNAVIVMGGSESLSIVADDGTRFVSGRTDGSPSV